MRRREGKVWMGRRLVLAVLLVVAGPLLAADEPVDEKDNPHLWSPRVTGVAVFKNGLGFFMREGEVALRDGWCASKEVPPAAFGTLAIFAHEKEQIVDIVGSGKGEVTDFDGTDAPKTVEAKRARLEACRNLSVQLTYTREEATLTVAGKLRSVAPKYAILQGASNDLAVPLEAITRMQVLDLPIRVHVKAEGEKTAKRAKLGMAYLRKGITWIPDYTLKILDENTAELTLRGTLVNEAEDLIHGDVHFVVGVPHFVHTEYMAPIAVGQVIRTIGAATAPRQVSSQVMSRAAIVSNLSVSRQFEVIDQPVGAGERALGGALGNLPEMAGPAGTDYTVYTKKDLTIRRGEKAIVTLFVKTIKYSHVYRWSPPAKMRHLLVLHNSTGTAWTTGPCLALSDGRPLSEDLLKYVPKGGSGEIPVTTAINVAHEQIESEDSRKLKAHSPSPSFYLDLVVLKGELTMKNFEKRPAVVIAEACVPGCPLTASDDGVRRADTKKLRLLERAGTIRWQIELAPGQKKTLTYSYERYVPSR